VAPVPRLPRLLRTPVTWMVAAECVVVALLLIVAWRLVAGVTGNAEPPVIAVPPTATASPSPEPVVPSIPKQGPDSPLPGLNLDSVFWRARLEQLNREQVYFEALEWRIVHTSVSAMQRYIESVVVPAVQRAERAGRA
jgi:hypothetical protein